MTATPREAGRVTYSAEIRALKRNLRMNQRQEAVMIGSILGDGHLDANWSKTNYRLKISQSVRQQEYVQWKYGIFRDWVLTGPKVHRTTNSLRFGTISHPEITHLHSVFHRGRKKIVPDTIGDYLSPLALAVWFMDDGNIRKTGDRVYGYYINTQSFTQDENALLAGVLNKKFGITTAIYQNHGKPRLYIGAKSKSLFREIVRPFVLPSLQYKLG